MRYDALQLEDDGNCNALLLNGSELEAARVAASRVQSGIVAIFIDGTVNLVYDNRPNSRRKHPRQSRRLFRSDLEKRPRRHSDVIAVVDVLASKLEEQRRRSRDDVLVLGVSPLNLAASGDVDPTGELSTTSAHHQPSASLVGDVAWPRTIGGSLSTSPAMRRPLPRPRRHAQGRHARCRTRAKWPSLDETVVRRCRVTLAARSGAARPPRVRG